MTKKIYGVGSTTSQNQQISHEDSETSYAGFALTVVKREKVLLKIAQL